MCSRVGGGKSRWTDGVRLARVPHGSERVRIAMAGARMIGTAKVKLGGPARKRGAG